MSNFYTNVKVIGNNVCYRGIENGIPVKYKVPYSPKIYIATNNPSKFKTIDDRYAEEIEPGSIRETKDFIKQYENVDNSEILGDIGVDVQFISDKFKGNIDWDIDLMSIYIIDIETASENVNAVAHKLTAPEEILLISMTNLSTRKVTTFTARPYTGTNENDAKIILCKDEYSLLNTFIEFWSRSNIDIITGFNSNGFDIPYLVNRISNVMDDSHVKRLSPWGLVTPRKVKGKFGKDDIVYDIAGISCLDFRECYLKYTYVKREQNSLEYISQVELGVGKNDHSEFASFKEFYQKNWNKFLEYNIVDTLLVLQLEDKLKLIELCLTMSYLAKINFNDVFSQIRMWDSIIYNHLKTKNIVIPKRASGSKSEKFEGAYVKEPVPGLYKWIVAVDATSLYPSIIQALNISPETFVGIRENISVSGLMRKECELSDVYATAANGAMYSKDKMGLLPELIDIYMAKRKDAKQNMLDAKSRLELSKIAKFDNRSDAKKEYKNLVNEISKFHNEQMAFKIAMNSLYGAIGNVFCRYFELENARAITLTGQYIIKTVGEGLNKTLSNMFKVDNYDWAFYSDTDSCYITLNPLVEKLYSKVSNEKLVGIISKISNDKLEPIINNDCLDLQLYINAYRNTINFKRETISSEGIWIAKKRYFMNVLDNEGVRYASPELKVMGMEVVKSSTPGVVRDHLKQCLALILENKEYELQRFIQDFKTKFKSLPVEDISFPRGVNGIDKYSAGTGYKSGCPIHTKGAILYNQKLRTLKLDNIYPIIGDGDRVKYTYLKTPNTIKDSVISFPSELPKEFNLDGYIDYDMQFNKAFLEPIRHILSILGWSIEKKNSIEDFF